MRLSQFEQDIYSKTIAAVTAAMVNKGRAELTPTAHHAAEYAKQNVLETRIQMKGDWNGKTNGNGNGNGKRKSVVRS